MPDKSPKTFPCRECQAGVMHPLFITYFTWLGSELVTVPDFPAWMCDICGRREYDQRAISWLTTMLSPETGRFKGVRPPFRRQAGKRESTRPATE